MLQRNSPVPLYHQLLEHLRSRIETGLWAPGERIPGEVELVDAHGVSRTTVRLALKELETLGLITRYRGRGTFVSEPKLAHGPRHGLTEQLEQAGRTPGWTVLSAQLESPPADVARRLGVEGQADVFAVRRLRLADDQPIGVLRSWVAPGVPHVDRSALSRGRSLDYLQASGVLVGATQDRVIEAIGANAEEASLLGVELGAPMLRIRRLTRSADDRPVEDFIGTYRGDRFAYTLSGGLE